MVRISELTASGSTPQCHCNGITQVRSPNLTENSADEDQRTVEEIMDKEDPVSSRSVLFVSIYWLLAIFFALLVPIAALVISSRS